MQTFKSSVSGEEFPLNERVFGHAIRPSIFSLIVADKSDFKETDCISKSELKRYKGMSAQLLLQGNTSITGTKQQQEKALVQSISEGSILSGLTDEKEAITTAQRIADKVAQFGGSWTFILSFGGFLFCWIVINTVVLLNHPFDPYPFILLNLILSCIAALQAPIIMMSQNRQEEKDRERSKNDYMVNLKAELEIRVLNEKIDHLIQHQQQELLEFQKKQMDRLSEIEKLLRKKNEHLT